VSRAKRESNSRCPGSRLARTSSAQKSWWAAIQVAREIVVRPGRRPVETTAVPADAFDPRTVVNGAFARRYAAQWRTASSSMAAAALKGLDRLGAADYPAAAAAFRASLAEARTKADESAVAFLLGWAFLGSGDAPQAITAWRRAAFVDPTIVPAHLALADAYVRLSQPALAIQALRAGLTALPDSPELNDRLSRLEPRR
jgi:predicted Zn-dependent protease